MNEKTVLIIERIFLAVIGTMIVLAVVVAIFSEIANPPSEFEPRHPDLVSGPMMVVGALVLTGLVFRWMAVVAHIVVFFVMLAGKAGGPGGLTTIYGIFDVILLFIMVVALLLLKPAIRRARKEH